MPIPGLEKVQTDPRVVSSILATEDVENKRREQAQRDQSNAMTLKAQQAGVREAERKTMGSTMAADAAEWAKNPAYAGKSFAEALKEPEVGSHFGTDVYGDAAADAPKAWNAAQQGATNKPVGMVTIPGLAENETMSVDESGRATKTASGATKTNALEKSLTPAEKAVDQKYAADFVDWETQGKSDALKSLSQLRNSRKTLTGGENVTGPIIGTMPDWALAWTNPKAIEAREAVEEVVQRNLRAVLGGQFAQREGERLIRRAFNPRLPEEENTKRLDRLTKQIENAAAAKDSAAAYFRKHGTLTGWEGKIPSISDFDPDNDATQPTPSNTETPPDTVQMTSPEGDIYYIPKANVEKARAKGFK